jgi:hypothetical protein
VATEWKVIRVASEVVDALQDVRTSLWHAHERGLVDGVLSRVDTITDNAVVAYLVRHYQKHRERRTRSQKRCRHRKQCQAQANASCPPLGTIHEPPVSLAKAEP